MAVYLDSSAIVKLVVDEPESRRLREHLAGREPFVSSALAYVEVTRAVRAQGAAAVAVARAILAGLGLLDIDRVLLEEAAVIEHESLRSLDAIHLASAAAFADDLSELVTYDARMVAAALAHGLPVATP